GARGRTRADLSEQARGDLGRWVKPPRTGAQPEDACEHALGARGRLGARERTEIHGPIGRQTLAHPEARKITMDAEREEADAPQLPSLTIVGRLQLADLARLQQRRRQLRA